MHATVTNDAVKDSHGPGSDCRVNKYIPIILFESMASILVGPHPPAMLQVHLAMCGLPIDQRVCHMHDTVTNDALKDSHGPGADCRVNKYIPIILFESMVSIIVGPDPPAMLKVHLAMGGLPID